MLQRAFPGLRLIWLGREDSLAQAVSLSRAVQTNKWFSFQPGSLRVREPWGGPHPEPRFDFAHINAMAHAVRRETEGWFQWFGANRIEPFRVRYEDLVEDMEGTTRSVLSFLGVELPNGAVTEPQDEKQADSVNAEWIARYRAMARDAADQRRGA